MPALGTSLPWRHQHLSAQFFFSFKWGAGQEAGLTEILVVRDACGTRPGDSEEVNRFAWAALHIPVEIFSFHFVHRLRTSKSSVS